MARRPVQPTPMEANLTLEQMKSAIPKINRRLADLAAFDPSSVRDRGDPRIAALESQLETLLTSVFGAGTVEFDRYRYQVAQLDQAGIYMGGTPIHEVIAGLEEGKAGAIAQLEAIKRGFEENLQDAGVDEGGRALRAYESLQLHPAIARASGSLFRDGHHAEAVENAVKALNAVVRLTSGVDDRDGSSLMEHVFSPNNPVLKFNALADQSDRDEQRGYMMMFSGAVAGLRNPRAHKIIKDDPEEAAEFIAFISLLAKLAERAAP